MSKHIGVYPGTFDPITKGHLDVIERGIKLFDVLVVAVVEGFDCLLMDYMRKKKAKIVLRGLRVVSDFEYEFQMALINRKLDPDIETVFMMTSDNYAPVSSRFIKEIARYGGDVSPFVTPGVSKKLKQKFGLKKCKE